MNIVLTVLTVILATDCLLLIGIILLQRGKGQGLAGAFGVGSMEEALGTHAASTAQRITWALAIVFLALSVAVGLLRIHVESRIPSADMTSPAAGTTNTDAKAPDAKP